MSIQHGCQFPRGSHQALQQGHGTSDQSSTGPISGAIGASKMICGSQGSLAARLGIKDLEAFGTIWLPWQVRLTLASKNSGREML